jgi:hypothetical protein
MSGLLIILIPVNQIACQGAENPAQQYCERNIIDHRAKPYANNEPDSYAERIVASLTGFFVLFRHGVSPDVRSSHTMAAGFAFMLKVVAR